MRRDKLLKMLCRVNELDSSGYIPTELTNDTTLLYLKRQLIEHGNSIVSKEFVDSIGGLENIRKAVYILTGINIKYKQGMYAEKDNIYYILEQK